MSHKGAPGVVLLPLLLSALALPKRIGSAPNALFVRPANIGPTSLCSHDNIGLLLPNPANHSATLLFADRHFDQSICAQPFPPGAPLLRLEVPLQFLPCGVLSRRLTFPRVGLEYSLRILLHFIDYPLNLLDPIKRIFDVRCQYFPDDDQYSSTVMELSALRSGFVVQEPPLGTLSGGRGPSQRPVLMDPECKYSIHSNSAEESSPSAGRVYLGDVVFHRWRCGDEYALKVYRCFVHDGHNRRHQIIDDWGCSTDLSLMPHPVYSANSSRASAAARVFRFSSSARVFFDCLLYACLKNDSECRRTTASQCDDNNAISVELTQKFRRRKRHTAQPWVRQTTADEDNQREIGKDNGPNHQQEEMDDATNVKTAQKMTAFVDLMQESTNKNGEEAANNEQKLHKALMNSRKAVKALVILNIASLTTALILACAFCGQWRRFFSSLSISDR